MTGPIKTNRDLYCALTAALKRRRKSRRSLEVYLSRLRELIVARENTPMSGDELALVLESAFVGPTPEVHIERLRDLASDERTPTWHRQLAQQIVDLREMAEAGTLENEHRFFGIDAPSGARWYNFDPHAYIECGLAGSFGGWAPGDDTGREVVPGKVAVLDENGDIVAVDPSDIDEPVVPLETISFDDLAEFLWAGQSYE